MELLEAFRWSTAPNPCRHCLASIGERRVDRMAPAAGTNSGFMLAQYTVASLVSEN